MTREEIRSPMPDTATRMPLTSADITADRVEQLRDLFPEVFTEGRIDFNKLRLGLGEAIDEGRERYGLTWSGKAEATRATSSSVTGCGWSVRYTSPWWR